MRSVCFACGEEQPPNDAPATNFTGNPGPGSRFADRTGLDEPLLICVCDTCLEAHAERVALRKMETTTVLHIRGWLCPGCARTLKHGICSHCSNEATS